MKCECLITDINRNIILFYSIEVYNMNKLFLSIYIMNEKKKKKKNLKSTQSKRNTNSIYKLLSLLSTSLR